MNGGESLVYRAKTQRALLGWLLIVMIWTVLINDLSNWLRFIQVIFTLIIFSSLFINFTFEIKEGYLIYQVLFFNVPLYKKSLYPNQIRQIKFKRVSWYSKGAIIQVKKGVTIRVVNFAPNDVFEELINFADKNSIPYTKTKDYIILEK